MWRIYRWMIASSASLLDRVVSAEALIVAKGAAYISAAQKWETIHWATLRRRESRYIIFGQRLFGGLMMQTLGHYSMKRNGHARWAAMNISIVEEKSYENKPLSARIAEPSGAGCQPWYAGICRHSEESPTIRPLRRRVMIRRCRP